MMSAHITTAAHEIGHREEHAASLVLRLLEKLETVLAELVAGQHLAHLLLDLSRVADGGERPADDRSHARADDNVDGDLVPLEGPQHPYVGQAPGGSTSQREPDIELEPIAHQNTQVTCVLDQLPSTGTTEARCSTSMSTGSLALLK